MVAKLVGEAADGVGRRVEGEVRIVVVIVRVPVYVTCCLVVISLRDGLCFREVQGLPSRARATRCVRDTVRVLEDTGYKEIEEELLILRDVALELIWRCLFHEIELEILQLVAASPERQ